MSSQEDMVRLVKAV